MSAKEEDPTDPHPPPKKKRRRPPPLPEADGVSAKNKKKLNGIKRYLQRPSYTFDRDFEHGSHSWRYFHRERLWYLLRQFVHRCDWDGEVSGVLSVLLKGTVGDNSPVNNRIKYWATMELQRHTSDVTNPNKILNVYDAWLKKIGGKKARSMEGRWSIQLEFILFCVAHGDDDGAYQSIISLMQERGVGSDPTSHLVFGLVFYHLWYIAIQKELQLKDLDDSSTSAQSETLQFKNISIDSSGNHGVEVREADSQSECELNTSIRIGKEFGSKEEVQCREVPMEADGELERDAPHDGLRRQAFHENSSGSHRIEKADASYSSIFFARALEPWLLPVRLPFTDQLEDFFDMQKTISNDNYNNAVKHLQLALQLNPLAMEALLPLIQILLLGDQVKEAVDEVEKFCQNSDAALPCRLRASMLEHFDSNNHAKLCACLEETLEKDPSCSQSLTRLIKMYHEGSYCVEKLIDMIALHLDGTYAEFDTWKEFAYCFLKLSQCEEDRMSMCVDGSVDVNEQKKINHFTRPRIFTDIVSEKNWRLRCRWWLTRHFSQSIFESEVASGDMEVLTYKAASASHIYGPEFEYVAKAHYYLEKSMSKELWEILQMHMQNSAGFYFDFHKKSHQSCGFSDEAESGGSICK